MDSSIDIFLTKINVNTITANVPLAKVINFILVAILVYPLEWDVSESVYFNVLFQGPGLSIRMRSFNIGLFQRTMLRLVQPYPLIFIVYLRQSSSNYGINFLFQVFSFNLFVMYKIFNLNFFKYNYAFLCHGCTKILKTPKKKKSYNFCNNYSCERL